MRGADEQTPELFSYIALEDRIPADHPLRRMKALVDPAIAALSPRFEALYAERGRPSIPPEQLLRALLLQVLYTIRSERQLIEQLDYNLLFRWFVGLRMDDAVWHPTTFTKNRERLLAGGIADALLGEVLRTADQYRLLSHEQFSVDGTLLEAWASQKSFQPKTGALPSDDDDPGNPTVNFHGQRRSNATHVSTTDPDARLARKGNGKEAKLSYQASVMMDRRCGLVVATVVGPPSGTAEIDQARELLTRLPHRRAQITLAADQGYATKEFVADCRTLAVIPHVAQGRRTPLDARTTRHPTYAASQRARKAIEECYGWGKTVGPLRKLKHRGQRLVDWIVTFTMTAYNLVRLRTLLPDLAHG